MPWCLQVAQKESELRSRPQSLVAGGPEEVSNGGAGIGGKDLTEAIESLPELLSRKANLEAHTNILQAVMKEIAAREVPTYYEVW